MLAALAGATRSPRRRSYEQYNTLQQNLANYIGSLYYSLGYTTPAHDLNPSISYNYDFSWEHRFHRTDTSFKLTPFYRNTVNKVQQFFISPSTGTVSGVNAGKQTAFGAEFLLASGDPNKDGFSTVFSYTYTYSRIRYGALPNGSTLLTPVNSSIQLYNSYTSACAAAAPSTNPNAPCGVFGNSERASDRDGQRCGEPILQRAHAAAARRQWVLSDLRCGADRHAALVRQLRRAQQCDAEPDVSPSEVQRDAALPVHLGQSLWCAGATAGR